jgi:hypothetical protein
MAVPPTNEGVGVGKLEAYDIDVCRSRNHPHVRSWRRSCGLTFFQLIFTSAKAAMSA